MERIKTETNIEIALNTGGLHTPQQGGEEETSLRKALGQAAYFAGNRKKESKDPLCNPYRLTGPTARVTSLHQWTPPSRFKKPTSSKP